MARSASPAAAGSAALSGSETAFSGSVWWRKAADLMALPELDRPAEVPVAMVTACCMPRKAAAMGFCKPAEAAGMGFWLPE